MRKITAPQLLKEIPDAPEYLYIRGTLPCLRKHIAIAVIGSRNHTPYGKRVCEEIIQGLSGYPIVIISGLAIGIDAIAHQAALDANLPCIAVPGSGLKEEVLYPKSNRHLAQKILKNNGCLLSEYEPDFKATRWSFPHRNRIMAGLAHGVLIIEARKKSGTSITAHLSLEYNRDVLAVPGSIFNLQSEGCNTLIQEGALPVMSAQDIITYFNL